MTKKLCVLALAAVCVGTTPAAAQVPGIGLEVEPYLGVFIPLRDVIEEEVVGVDVTASHKEAFGLGGRVTLWLVGALGVEGNFLYTLSEVEFEDPLSGEAEEVDAHTWALDGRLIFRLIPGPVGLHLDGGVALVGRGGDAYEDVEEGTTSLGGVVGAGLRIKLPGLFAIRGDADVYIYSAQITAADPDLGGTVEFDSQLQADVMLSAGLVIGIL